MNDLDPGPSDACNLVLTGFMGTGKTTIGRLVAARLGLPFVDMDAEIEGRTGQSVPDIFASQGEEAFRQMERALCQELSERRGLVVATGGGALLDPVSREIMIRSGFVICLTASPEALVERLAGVDDRPLLHGNDPAARVRTLIDGRREAYAALPYHLDTTHLAPELVAEAVLDLWHTHYT
jgi:shikimate kinase